jgi:2',3'-cyclic-nucleotide 2'-phosphodiesterase
VRALIPDLRAEHQVDLVIANAENAAGGKGITAPLAGSLLCSEVDVLTLGNHTFAKMDGIEELLNDPRILRPANYPPGTPGRGWGLFRTRSGHLVGVANFLGRALMEPVDDPFRVADDIIEQARAQTPLLFIDFHAEATSEKMAFGWHCDGRASAVIGTHTHVQTADERILPGGCAYLTDVGMCGVVDSVIGMDVSNVLARFRTGLPNRFQVAEGRARLCGVLIDLDEVSGRARKITRVASEE